MFPMQPFMWSAFSHGMPFGYPHPSFMTQKQESSAAVPFEAEAQKSLKRMFRFELATQSQYPQTCKRSSILGKRIPDGQHCLICDEPAKGYNYGVASCDGCKTFFRRSMLCGETFVCLKGGNCDVTGRTFTVFHKVCPVIKFFFVVP